MLDRCASLPPIVTYDVVVAFNTTRTTSGPPTPKHGGRNRRVAVLGASRDATADAYLRRAQPASAGFVGTSYDGDGGWPCGAPLLSLVLACSKATLPQCGWQRRRPRPLYKTALRVNIPRRRAERERSQTCLLSSCMDRRNVISITSSLDIDPTTLPSRRPLLVTTEQGAERQLLLCARTSDLARSCPS